MLPLQVRQPPNPDLRSLPSTHVDTRAGARRINTLFSLSKHWKSYDVFGRQKMSTFKSSRPAVTELAAKYKELVSELDGNFAEKKDPDHAAESLLFREMCEICLWGNATDLSLLTSLTYEDIQKLQGSDARKASEKNIIVNDIPAAYEVLRAARDSGRQTERRVDIVLDNAGFELFVDLILAGYLLATGLATTVVLHPKSIPWFVSDVLPGDFASLLSALADPQSFYTTRDEDDAGKGFSAPAALSTKEEEDIKFLFAHWSGAHAEGQLIIRPNRFWTQGGSFWRLPSQAPELYDDLCQSEVVIFKGDLNYRKLTADVSHLRYPFLRLRNVALTFKQVMWPATTPFPTALGPLGKSKSGIRTLALRTCKADVVVGLPEGEDERLLATEGGEYPSSRARKWAWSGKWAVVQFFDGKAGTVGR